jgi:hypothetical protein
MEGDTTDVSAIGDEEAEVLEGRDDKRGLGETRGGRLLTVFCGRDNGDGW